MPNEFGSGEPGILGNAARQNGRNVARAVDRHGGASPVGVDEPLVGPALAHFAKTERGQDGDDLTRSENRQGWHDRSDPDGLRPDELSLNRRLALLEDEGNDFGEVGVEFVQRRCLAVGASEAGYVSDIETGIAAPLDNGGVGSHGGPPVRARSLG